MGTSGLAAIELAIEKLGAVRLADGEYAHRDDGTRRWYVVDESDLESYVTNYLESDKEEDRREAYSLWCADTAAREMPNGWEPNRP